MIDSMPLPSRKLVKIIDDETNVVVEIKQVKRRIKYYSLSQLKDSEPDTYKTIIKVSNALKSER